jgi:ribosome maturation factor RimP
MLGDAPDKWYELIEPVVEGLGYELAGIEWHGGGGRHNTLRVYIDREGGVNVDDCARVSHQVSGLLDVEEPIPGRYDLEVSSPGLDRPLLRERDFERFSGRRVTLRLRVALDKRKKFTGVLVGLVDGQLTVDAEGGPLTVPLDNLRDVRLVPEF